MRTAVCGMPKLQRVFAPFLAMVFACLSTAWADDAASVVADDGRHFAPRDVALLILDGEEAFSQQRFDEAEELYLRALRLSEIIGDLEFTADSFDHLADVARVRGEWFWATKYYGSALNRYEMLGESPQQAELHLKLADVAIQRGHLEAAEDEYRRAVYGFEESGHWAEQARVYTAWSKFRVDRGDHEGAAQLLRQAHAAYLRTVEAALLNARLGALDLAEQGEQAIPDSAQR